VAWGGADWELRSEKLTRETDRLIWGAATKCRDLILGKTEGERSAGEKVTVLIGRFCHGGQQTTVPCLEVAKRTTDERPRLEFVRIRRRRGDVGASVQPGKGTQ